MVTDRLKRNLRAACIGVLLAATPVAASATCYTKHDIEQLKSNLVVYIDHLENQVANYPRRSHVGRILRHKLRYSYRLLHRLERRAHNRRWHHHVHGNVCHPDVSRS